MPGLPLSGFREMWKVLVILVVIKYNMLVSENASAVLDKT